MLKTFFIAITILLSIILYSCSASTDTRYSKDSEEKSIKNEEIMDIIEDDFDINPYRTKIEIDIDNDVSNEKPSDLWFGYPEESSKNNITDTIETNMKKTVIDSIPGYRVQVISTDDLDEANGIRSEVYFRTNEKAVYVIFEPPFYIVRVGDFKKITDAKALSFKLNQLGFQGTKVVNDIINIFK